MKLMSVNIRGFGKTWKRKWLREIVDKESLEFLAIQETKLSDISSQFVRSLWDSDDYGFVAANAIGKAGGLLWVWSTSHSSTGEGFVLILGEMLSSKKNIILVNVYGPQSEGEKKVLWSLIGA